MDEKDFKKHLKDLAEGHHHPEEHDWADGAQAIVAPRPAKAAKKTASRAAKAKKKSPASPAKKTGQRSAK